MKNREIKFRAWYPNEKYMAYDVPVYKNKNLVIDNFGDGLKYWFVEESIIMQFTGMHDKNGKEIYEGDIIKYPDYVLYIKSNKKEHFSIGEIRFFIGSHWFYNNGFRRCVSTLFAGNLPQIPPLLPSDFEIIGNIYENPELLIE